MKKFPFTYTNFSPGPSFWAALLFPWAFLGASQAFAQTSLTTYHNDQARDGWNQNETILTTANVNSTNFGKLFSDTVDGQVYAQPLYMPNISIGGGTHNVAYVVTENDSAYAFDADSAGVTYWHTSFLTGGAMPVSLADVGNCTQISPEIGITDTPVIDPTSGIMYFVAMTKTVSGGVTTYTQTLHALNITTGAETANGPQTIGATAPGKGDGGTTVTFRPRAYKERCALALVNGVVYTSWTGHCDNDGIAGNYYGWVIGYSASNITQQLSVYCSAPNGSESSFWESGDGPSVDSAGNLYYLSANGTFDTTAPVSDYGQCFLKLNTVGNAVTALDYFAPMSQASMSSGDQDVGSAGQCLLPASWGTTAHPNIIIGADKPSDLYVVDADTGKMGEFSSTANNIIQTVYSIGGKGYTSPAIYSNGTTNWVYWGMSGEALKAFTFANGQYVTTPSSATAAIYGAAGSFSTGCVPSVSSNGNTNGIVWALYPGTPVTLFAYDATNLATMLYNSGQNSARDTATAAYVKFELPSVVNGKVYVPTSSSLVVYGLLTTSSTSTPTGTPAVTATPTSTASRTPTSTPTTTASPTATSTPTRTATLTPTSTSTSSATASPTGTPSSTSTTSPTATASRTPTATASLPATSTPTLTATFTPMSTSTSSATASATTTGTPTFSFTPTGTPTSTASSTPTKTASPTTTSTPTSTSTPSSTPTRTATSTASGTATDTPVNSFTATSTPTNSATGTMTRTATLTATSTNTSTPSFTFTSTVTSTSTASSTPTRTSTSTNSPTASATTTNTPVNSFTATSTPTNSATLTATGTATRTETPTLVPTSTLTTTPTASPTSTGTAPFTPTRTPTSTATLSPTFTTSPTVSLTFTRTLTPSPTWTPSPMASSTATPQTSPTPLVSVSATPGSSSTPVLYPNPVTGGSVTLLVNLSTAGSVHVQIFTLSFREVLNITLPEPAGTDKLDILLKDKDGKPLANGLYYVLITVNGKRSVLKLLILE